MTFVPVQVAGLEFRRAPGLSHSGHCAHNKPYQDRRGINGGGTTEIWYLGDGRGMAARVLPVPTPQRTLDVRKRQVVAPGKLNTGTVDLGQRDRQRDLQSFVVTYNKTRQSSGIKYTGVAPSVPALYVGSRGLVWL